jgi:hypothetical protein
MAVFEGIKKDVRRMMELSTLIAELQTRKVFHADTYDVYNYSPGSIDFLNVRLKVLQSELDQLEEKYFGYGKV